MHELRYIVVTLLICDVNSRKAISVDPFFHISPRYMEALIKLKRSLT